MQKLIVRIEREAGVPDLAGILERLPGADFTSLMLEVVRRRGAALTPADLLRPRDLFPPSDLDARRHLALIAAAFDAAEGFEALELSPVCPLGTNKVLGGIDQMNVLAALRGAEVLADPTSAMALAAVARARPVRLCATARPMRLQPLPPGSGFTRHFRQFALVTAGRVSMPEAMREHIRVYLRFLLGLRAYRFPELEVAVVDFSDRQDVPALLAPLAAEYPSVRFREGRERTQGRGYYDGLALTLSAVSDGSKIPFGDGGFTPWMARLCSDRKERFLGTGIGVDMLLRRFAS